MLLTYSSAPPVKMASLWRRFPQQLHRLNKSHYSSGGFNRPVGASEFPRAGGISSLFRLPVQEGKPEGLDACFIGIPMDTGCNYRSGARHAPRAVRQESFLIQSMNITGALPFESLQVADIGDVPVVPYNLQRSMEIITEYYHRVMAAHCIPLTMGGDHSLSYPILRAIKEKHGAVGLIQIDAHTDFNDTMQGEKLANGTAFCRVLEEGLVDPQHMVQIGLRGSVEPQTVQTQFEWAQKQVRCTVCQVKGSTFPPYSPGHQASVCHTMLAQITHTSHGQNSGSI